MIEFHLESLEDFLLNHQEYYVSLLSNISISWLLLYKLSHRSKVTDSNDRENKDSHLEKSERGIDSSKQIGIKRFDSRWSTRCVTRWKVAVSMLHRGGDILRIIPLISGKHPDPDTRTCGTTGRSSGAGSSGIEWKHTSFRDVEFHSNSRGSRQLEDRGGNTYDFRKKKFKLHRSYYLCSFILFVVRWQSRYFYELFRSIKLLKISVGIMELPRGNCAISIRYTVPRFPIVAARYPSSIRLVPNLLLSIFSVIVIARIPKLCLALR